MDLEEILALDNERVRAKEAEVLATLTEFTGPARRQLEGAKRDFGRVAPPELLTVFIDPVNQEMARRTIRACIDSLFDVYAQTAFQFVLDPEPFIELLTPIGERVRSKLGVTAKDELEVRKLKWEGIAWQRGKPTGLRWVLKWLLSFLSKPAQKTGPTRVDLKPQVVTPPGEQATVGNGADATPGDVGESPNSASPESAAAPANRASWLEARLLERGWSTSTPSQWGGPDRKTIDKILSGKAVGNPVLQKLAAALSKQVRNVDVLDIPKN